MNLKYLAYLSVLGLCMLPTVLLAKVPPEKAAMLGGEKYTCMGALRSGTELGVAEYSGKWLYDFPGSNEGQGYPGNPYKAEEPQVVITAQNYKQYADHLTAGQEALFRKYPDEFKMPIYPSHRDFRFPPFVCETIKKNAVNAELIHNGLGVTGTTGALPFPFPETGLQAMWSVINSVRPWTQKGIYHTIDVFSDGSRFKGKVLFKTMSMNMEPDTRRKYQNTFVRAYFYRETLAPAKNSGKIAVGFQPNDFSESATQSWQYLPGIRRVRKAPEIGFDYPVPPNGLRVVSGDYVFNGSPGHFNWELKGKVQMYVPYNNFRFNKPGIAYDKLLLSHTVNPKYMRYELHRVWKIVGTLKDEYRSIYGKRVIYVDEDSWLALWGDNYDTQGNLYRVSYVTYFYSPQSGTYVRGASIYQDLHKDAYEVTYLTNNTDLWWQINIPMYKSMFTPKAAARHGH